MEQIFQMEPISIVFTNWILQFWSKITKLSSVKNIKTGFKIVKINSEGTFPPKICALKIIYVIQFLIEVLSKKGHPKNLIKTCKLRKTEKCALLSRKFLSHERWNVELYKKLVQTYYKRAKGMETAFIFKKSALFWY